MHALGLKEAAAFLHLSPSTLGMLARSGKIKAAKPGKRWVFLERDLVAYLDRLYAGRGQAPQRDCEEETSQWQFINAAPRGGLASQRPAGKEYAALLGLTTRG
ncbi:helix-turn-helix domain-containing protein [Motiliproteus sediminis]|uniref:helix-turn-helix domain-containing protein n=1 Tax=Motiliproteus sediminis TaxID=1468178 RepID=UPI001AEF58D7|nr:helix-turn-helix domain-containing protein [Motiliproteus sediminis]